MPHPLERVPDQYRRPLLIAFLFLTLALFAVFRILDQPLRTDAAPNGIVSFELAGSPGNSQEMVSSWSPKGLLFAAFGLGLDYLFMPSYALALAFATLLVMQKHVGWIRSLGSLAGYGALAAPLFDAVENYALWKVLLGAFKSYYPLIAAACATLKFGLLLFGLLIVLLGLVYPKK